MSLNIADSETTEHSVESDLKSPDKISNSATNASKEVQRVSNLHNEFSSFIKRIDKENCQRKVTSRSANLLFLLLRIVMCFNVLVKKLMFVSVLVSGVCAYKEQKFAIEPQDQVSQLILMMLDTDMNI